MNSQWISVDDRLPEKGQQIGYVYAGGIIRVDFYCPSSSGSWEYEECGGWYEIEKNVTHWMPLPEGPEDE